MASRTEATKSHNLCDLTPGRIKLLRSPANAPSTKGRKRGGNPLVDTGRLQRLIRVELDEYRKRKGTREPAVPSGD